MHQIIPGTSLTPVPQSLGTADGFFNKRNKAAFRHCLLEGDLFQVDELPSDSFYIQDGNALFHSLINIQPIVGEVCLQILNQMVSKKDFIFSTDSYHMDSIKTQERLRRDFSQRYIVEGPATRRPSDFKLFLANEQNKSQLSQLLLHVWQSETAARHIGRISRALVVVDGRTYQLSVMKGDVRINITTKYVNQPHNVVIIILYFRYISHCACCKMQNYYIAGGSG